MKALVKGLKSFYEFFAGDAILLLFVAVAFGATAAFRALDPRHNTIAVAIFVVLIVTGLITSLVRSKRLSCAQFSKGEK